MCRFPVQYVYCTGSECGMEYIALLVLLSRQHTMLQTSIPRYTQVYTGIHRHSEADSGIHKYD